MLTHKQISRSHGREQTDGTGAEQLIAVQPSDLWSQGPTDVGLCNIAPVTFDLSSTEPIWVPQYRNKPEADEGIASTVQGLLERGVITPWKSPWNTPIFPVQKPATNKYRLVHDLRRINSMVVTPTLAVPNPYITISNLTPAHQWFTCIGLANAFFCIPLSEECKSCLAFTYRGRQYSYNRLPQGFILTPGIFNKVERMNLTLKMKLAKICAQTKLTWLSALPLVLMSVRSSVNRISGFTPFELLTGRSFPGPSTPLRPDQITPLSHCVYFDKLIALIKQFSQQVTVDN